MNKTLIFVFGLVAILFVFAYMNRETFQARQVVSEDSRALAKNREAWYKINDDNFTPPLLVFLNGCWASETSEDVFFTNALKGDFRFKDGLKQEVWFNDFDSMEAYYNGQKTWGGDLYRNRKGDRIKVNNIVYSSVNCYTAGMTE